MLSKEKLEGGLVPQKPIGSIFSLKDICRSCYCSGSMFAKAVTEDVELVLVNGRITEHKCYNIIFLSSF